MKLKFIFILKIIFLPKRACSLVRKGNWEERAQFTLSSKLNEILIGLLLGDLYILKQRVNPSLTFRQGIKHEDYLRYLYDLFKDFCPSGPTIQIHAPDKRTGKVYSAISRFFSGDRCLATALEKKGK